MIRIFNFDNGTYSESEINAILEEIQMLGARIINVQLFEHNKDKFMVVYDSLKKIDSELNKIKMDHESKSLDE